MSTAKKLPKGLPPLPKVPDGFAQWSRPKQGPCDVPINSPVALWHDMRRDWTIGTGIWKGNDSQCWYAVAIPAIKRPAAKKAKGKRVVASIVDFPDATLDKYNPHFILPADAASVERMAEQIAKAHAQSCALLGKEVMMLPTDYAVARLALAAIGLTAPKKGARK